MPTTNMGYSSATDYDAEARKLERKRQLAAALMAQGQQPLQGQMIGRVYVPPSPLQGVANMAQTWAGSRGMKKADKRESELGEQRNAMIAQALRDYSETGDPTALMTNADTRGMGWQEQQATTEAQRKLYADALKRQDEQQGKVDIEHIKGSYRDQPLTAEQRMELGRKTAAGAAGFAPEVFTDRNLGAMELVRTPQGITARPLTYNGQNLMPPQYDPSTMGAVSGAKAGGGKLGTASADAQIDLANITANMPKVQAAVDRLSALGKDAAYTLPGRGWDYVSENVLGREPREASVARQEYEATMKNEVLELLRETFGAQFTEKDREALLETLGDTNVAPARKDAILRSYINSKLAKAGAAESLVEQYAGAQVTEKVDY